VHALGQVFNSYLSTRLKPDVLLKAVNSQLPADVAITDIIIASQSFDANKDAVAKRYRYCIDDGRIPDPFHRRGAWQPRQNLDGSLMHAAAQVLLGRHDFRCFETNFPNRLTSVRTIADLAVSRDDAGLLRIEVQADGFLYNMVRAIAGTLYQVGRGYWPPERVGEILALQSRAEAGPTAPPQGLYMLWVKY
jgi:tRNA pseudouridine38-40 synthase